MAPVHLNADGGKLCQSLRNMFNRSCKLCKSCQVDQGKSCPTPERIRPCDQSFGIDVYKTARSQGLPCDVLQNKEDVQNRYGFVLLE